MCNQNIWTDYVKVSYIIGGAAGLAFCSGRFSAKTYYLYFLTYISGRPGHDQWARGHTGSCTSWRHLTVSHSCKAFRNVFFCHGLDIFKGLFVFNVFASVVGQGCSCGNIILSVTDLWIHHKDTKHLWKNDWTAKITALASRFSGDQEDCGQIHRES